MNLPDVAQTRPDDSQTLDWVGMCGIALPLRIAGRQLAGQVDAGVSLDDGAARGIHMSRLYLALEPLSESELSPASMLQVLQAFLASHARLSRRASLRLRTRMLLRRPALLSPLSGWQAYPLEVEARLDEQGFHVELSLEIGYSSTCPCSAALARQAIQQRFVSDFGNRPLDHEQLLAWLGSEQGIMATPHSQRSTARVRARLQEGAPALPLEILVDSLEQALGTPLQTAVKRADEQAFAIANGQNPMFCEDAARRLHRALRQLPEVAGFDLRVEHAESLHAHDAVAQSSWRWAL